GPPAEPDAGRPGRRAADAAGSGIDRACAGDRPAWSGPASSGLRPPGTFRPGILIGSAAQGTGDGRLAGRTGGSPAYPMVSEQGEAAAGSAPAPGRSGRRCADPGGFPRKVNRAAGGGYAPGVEDLRPRAGRDGRRRAPVGLRPGRRPGGGAQARGAEALPDRERTGGMTALLGPAVAGTLRYEALMALRRRAVW